MPRPPRRSRPVRRFAEPIEGLDTLIDGRVELTLYQLCLLLALRDLPRHRAANRLVWAEAAMRYLREVRDDASFRCLYVAAGKMPASLVTQAHGERRGVAAQPTPAGRELPDRHGDVSIVGYGVWEGFMSLLATVEARRKAARRLEPAPPPLAFVRGDLWGGPLDGGHVALRAPARDEVTCMVPMADGSERLARYRRAEPDQGERVTVASNGHGEPVGTVEQTVIPLLAGKRGVRYRYDGML